MKKLLALVIAGGFLALITGCPPATSNPAPATKPPVVAPTSSPAAPTKPAPLPTKPADKPVVDKPVVDKPVVDKPVVDKPVVDKPVDAPKTHDGKVVKVADGKLTMKGTDDKEHVHDISKAKITGGKMEDLKEGVKIEVTTNDKGDVTTIDIKK